MRGIFKVGVAAVALAVVMAGATRSEALIEDRYTSFTQPANALVMPFDNSGDNEWRSFFVVSNIAGTSRVEGGDYDILGVTTHWTYWSDTCQHLVDVWVCLTLNDTIVVDPTDISSVDSLNEQIGPKTNLAGRRGMVVVTAYETDEICSDGAIRGYRLVDNAIVGSATRADVTGGGYSFGNDAIGLGTSLDGDYTELPKFTESNVDILTFNPKSTDNSSVAFLSLKEGGGSGTTAAQEVGPNASAISATAVFYDNMEIGTSMPDVSVKCTTFATLDPSDDSGATKLIPSTIDVDTSGFIRLSGLNPYQDATANRFVYALHGQSVGSYGGSNYGKYKFGLTTQ